jgi:hypothetical protein
MEKYKRELSKMDRQEKQLNDWCNNMNTEQPMDTGSHRRSSNKCPQSNMSEMEEKMMEVIYTGKFYAAWLLRIYFGDLRGAERTSPKNISAILTSGECSI